MENNSIVKVQNLLDNSKEVKDAEIFDPGLEVQSTLFNFLKTRLHKIQEDCTFEDKIKAQILEKIPEATFGELLRLLDTIQNNNNSSMEKILIPFLARNSDGKTILEDSKKKAGAEAPELSKEMSKELVVAFQELSEMLNTAKVASKKTSDEIKDALKS